MIALVFQYYYPMLSTNSHLTYRIVISHGYAGVRNVNLRPFDTGRNGYAEGSLKY